VDAGEAGRVRGAAQGGGAMTPTLSAYIARRFLTTLFWAFAVVFIVIFLGNLLEMLRRSASTDAGFLDIAAIAALQTPSTALTASPFIVMLATLAAFARLARASELVVTRAAGVSAWALIAPVVLSSALLGAATFAALNPVAAATKQRAETLEARHLSDRASRLSISGEGLWLRQGGDAGPTVIHARGANARATELRAVTLFAFNGEGVILSRTDAATATLTPGAWLLRDAVRREIAQPPGGDALSATATRFETLTAPTELTSDQIIESFQSPESLSFWALPGFIATLEEAGFSARRHRLHWQAQLALPLLFAGMAMIGAAFSMRHTRQGGLGLMALAAVIAGFGFYFIADLAKALGASGAIPVALAAWAPPVSATLVAAGLLLHLEDG